MLKIPSITTRQEINRMLSKPYAVLTLKEIEEQLKEKPTKDYLYKLLRKMQSSGEIMAVPGLIPKHFKKYEETEVIKQINKPTLDTLDERAEMILEIFGNTTKLKAFGISEDELERFIYLAYRLRTQPGIPDLLRNIATVIELTEEPKKE